MSGQAAHRFNNDVRYRDAQHPSNTAFTPEYVLAPLRYAMGGIALDPCTTPDNPVRAYEFYAPPQDGLSLPWVDRTFVNPPYGKAREPWVDRCIVEGGSGKRVVLLMPAATDTRAFQRAAASADGIVFVRGRLKFGVLRPNRRQVAASHPSALFGWGVDMTLLGCLGVASSPSTTPGDAESTTPPAT